MTNVFPLRIISPAAIVVDAHATLVEIPGAEGDFGVLAHHAPFFSMIRPGVIIVDLVDGHRRRFFAATGYADVSDAGCTILSDHIQDLSDITPVEAREALIAADQAERLAEMQ